MRNRRRVVVGAALSALALVGAAAPLVTGARPAAAAEDNPPMAVTTTADVLDPDDGLLSLREAVILADDTAGNDTIYLATGATYDLTLCGESGDLSPDGTIGDLDSTDLAKLTISGDPNASDAPTIHQTCPQRVIRGSSGPILLEYLAVSGGEATGGGAIRADGPLVLDHVDQSGATVPGSASEDDGAVYSTVRPLSIADSTIHDNSAAGIYQSGAGGTPTNFVVARSTILGNEPVGAARAAGIDSPGPVTLDASEVSDNVTTGAVGGVYSLDATLTGSVVSGNVGGRSGGLLGRFGLTDSHLVDNRSTGIGGAGGGMGRFIVLRSTVAGNHSAFIGGGLAGSGSITDSTVSGNDAVNMGGGLAVEAEVFAPGETTLVLTNSTVTGNRGAIAGGIVVVDDWVDQQSLPVPGPTHQASVVVASSTVVGNTPTPLPSPAPGYDPPSVRDLAFARWSTEPESDVVGRLDIVSSVLGSGPAADPVCALEAASPVASGGYTFAADGSCAVGAEVGDVSGGGSPGLGALADNGGPTLTMMPEPGSPLIDAVPSVFETCGGTDQRGADRPIGARCEIGAVESDSELFPREAELTPVVPQRLMDTRSDPAYHVGSQHRFGPNEEQQLVVAGGSTPVPSDATAIVANVTAVDPNASSHLDLWPTGAAQPNVSNLNYVPGQTVPNLVKVKVGTGGRISLFNRNGSVDAIVDVVGYYRNDPSAARFTPIVPKRIADTRVDPAYHTGPMNRLGDRTDPRTLKVTDPPTIPSTAVAVVANVTVVDPTASSHLDLWPQNAAKPNVSNLNYVAGQTVANLVLVKVNPANGKISLLNQNGSVDVIVDVVGYFTADPAAAGFVATIPNRIADTRADPAYHVGSQSRLGDRNDGRTVKVTGGAVPEDARAIVANVTVVGPSAASHLDVWPAGTTKPNVSNINFLPGQTVPNLVTVKIGPGGSIALLNQNGSTDVIIDVVGYYR